MPSLSRKDAPVSVSSPRSIGEKNHVDFADTLVTSVSRPADIAELNILWDFEHHAATRICCRNPYALAIERQELCPEGKQLAVLIASLLFKMSHSNKVFYESRTTGQETRIEIPPQYNNSISLLKAIRDFGHGIIKPRPVSYDRSYPISPRMPSQRQSVKYMDEPVITYDIRTVEPSSLHRSTSHRHSKTRGSLYALDEQTRIEAAHRERSTKYNYAVREPRHSSYHR